MNPQLSSQYPQQTVMQQPPVLAPPPKLGPIGDGIQDDTIAVQAAFSQAPVGYDLVFPPGTYRITAPLIIDKPMSLKGGTFVLSFPQALWAGQARCDNGDTWKQHLLVVRADGVTIAGVTFANGTTIEGTAAVLVEGNNFTFSNCIVSDFCQGLMVGKLKSPYTPPATYRNINITNNQFTNIRGVPGGSIAYGDGILFFGCENVLIDGNCLTAAPGRTPRNGINSGPEGFTVSHTVSVTNNRVLGDWDYPITTEGGKKCLIANNITEGCCIVGIIERGEEITVRDNMVKIVGGRQHGCTCGIQFYGVNNSEIVKNVVTGAAKHGIACMPSHETAGSANIIVKDNSVEGDFFYGIYVGNSSTTHVTHNRVILTHKEKSSTGVVGWYTSDLNCKDNDIQATNGTGCIFTGSNKVNMCSNLLAGSRAGLYVAKECCDVTISQNDFSACKECKHDAHPDVKSLNMDNNAV